MKKFRASYTVLNLWRSGAWEDAIKQYFKLQRFTSKAMKDGQDFHEEWREETARTKCLPAIFGGAPLQNPETEQKIVVQVEPWLELVYVMDLYDKPVIYDYKTGVTSSEAYAGEMQLPLYAVGATFSGRFVEKGIIYHYNQYTRKVDSSHVWITDKLLNDAHNWLITYSSEMHVYLDKNGLYDRFAKEVKTE